MRGWPRHSMNTATCLVYTYLTAGHQRAIYCLENVADNLLVSGGDDGVKIWKWEHLLNPSEVSIEVTCASSSLFPYCIGGETSGYFSAACFVSSVRGL